MSKVLYEKVLGGPMSPAHFRLQMADQTTWQPEGVAENILVRIKKEYVPTDFVILDIGNSAEVPLLLGRPFLHTTKAAICVGKGVAAFALKGKTINMPFNGYIRNNQVKKNQPKR